MSENHEGKSKKSVVTKEEEDFIAEKFDGPFWFPMGILTRYRETDQPLEEIIKVGIRDHNSEEQTKDWENAGKFIKDNAERFGIKRQNPDQGR